mgnify:CR=1 FL=1
MSTNTPTYTIDEDTRSLLEEVLQMAQRVVDLQYDDDAAEDLQSILAATADRFGIATTEFVIEDDGEGTITMTLSEPEKPKPKFRVISNDTPDDA